MRWMFVAPLCVLAIVLAGLGYGLTRNPRALPSVLVDKQAPTFELPPVVPDRPGFKTSDLKVSPALVNVWASWCVPCRAEHPLLMRLAQETRIYGINIKDKPSDAQRFLDELGNPYAGIGADQSGRTAIDWGVYGVPETFVTDADGRIRFRHVGPLTDRVIDEAIRPLLVKLGR